jgi:hypothetical protein
MCILLANQSVHVLLTHPIHLISLLIVEYYLISNNWVHNLFQINHWGQFHPIESDYVNSALKSDNSCLLVEFESC